MTHHPLHLYTKHNKYYDNVCKLQRPISNDTRIRQISETLTNKTFIPIGYQQFSDKTPLSISFIPLASFHVRVYSYCMERTKRYSTLQSGELTSQASRGEKAPTAVASARS